MPDESQQNPPEDFAAYEAWKNNPEPEAPEVTEETPSEAAEPAEETAAETAPESETGEEAEQEEETHEEQPKKKGGFQRRIDRLTREKAELAAALEELRRNSAGSKEATPQPAATDAKEPDPKDYSTWEEYTAAMVDHRLSLREKAREAEQQKQREAEARRAATAKWTAEVEKGRDEYDDFDEVVVNSKAPVSPVIQQFILESEAGRHVAYALGKDAGALERINKLTPVAAIRELTKIEAKYTTPTPEPKPKVTQAPKPVKPVAAGAVKTGPRIDDENLSFEDYEKLRQKQLKRR